MRNNLKKELTNQQVSVNIQLQTNKTLNILIIDIKTYILIILEETSSTENILIHRIYRYHSLRMLI